MRVCCPFTTIRRGYMHSMLYLKKEKSCYACILKQNEIRSEESLAKEIKSTIDEIEDKHFTFLKQVSADDFLKYGSAKMLEFMKCKFESELGENMESSDNIMKCEEKVRETSVVLYVDNRSSGYLL